MTHPRFCMAQPCNIFIHCLYLAMLNPVRPFGYIAQIVERQNDYLMIAGQCWFEPAVRHFFSSHNVNF